MHRVIASDHSLLLAPSPGAPMQQKCLRLNLCLRLVLAKAAPAPKLVPTTLYSRSACANAARRHSRNGICASRKWHDIVSLSMHLRSRTTDCILRSCRKIRGRWTACMVLLVTCKMLPGCIAQCRCCTYPHQAGRPYRRATCSSQLRQRRRGRLPVGLQQHGDVDAAPPSLQRCQQHEPHTLKRRPPPMRSTLAGSLQEDGACYTASIKLSYEEAFQTSRAVTR